jgi:hypothetical protein
VLLLLVRSPDTPEPRAGFLSLNTWVREIVLLLVLARHPASPGLVGAVLALLKK